MTQDEKLKHTIEALYIDALRGNSIYAWIILALLSYCNKPMNISTIAKTIKNKWPQTYNAIKKLHNLKLIHEITIGKRKYYIINDKIRKYVIGKLTLKDKEAIMRILKECGYA